ncbi:MAG: DUF1273 family protein [Nitrospirae bacterium]|nr:DUF1273 family protein [Nitrospirota bacterium]
MTISKGITGLGLGPETDFAELCMEMKVPFVAAIAYDGWERDWPEESRKHYWDLLEKAEDVVFVCGRGYGPWKIPQRNKWIIGQAEALIAVWNERAGLVGECVKAAVGNGLRVKIIDPRWYGREGQQAA